MIQKLFNPFMENEFLVKIAGKESHQTFPIRVSPLSLTNRQLLNKIRINHNKLPSQFFSNPRSMPDLQASSRAPSLEIWRRRRQKTAKLCINEENGSKEATRSLKDYKSTQMRRSKEQQRKINDLFMENDELGVTFSKLPIKRVQNSTQKSKQLERAYFKKVSTEPYEEVQDRFSKKQENLGLTMKIDGLFKARQGISIRKNNHPVTTLREIKRQCN